MSPRYLTKSRFKLALECPTKLFYTKKNEYADKKLNDSFLKSLAEGGFQVGELAKCYFAGGVDIDELDYETSLARTVQLLKLDHVIIYEAAFLFQNLFIRADIVVKNGNDLFVYEVKAKSIDGSNACFTNRKGIDPKWKPYLYDIAFQKYVIQESYPDLNTKAFLMLADKSSVTTVEGLNQRFLLKLDEKGRARVEIVGNVELPNLGDKILCAIPVDEIVDEVLNAEVFSDNPTKSFKEWIHFYAEMYGADTMINVPIGARCKACEFVATPDEIESGHKNGFHECWIREANFNLDHFEVPSVLDIWDFRKKEEHILKGNYYQHQIVREDLEPKSSKIKNEPGLSRVDRQELQIDKSRNRDSSDYLDIEGLGAILEELTYPLHFIDFETSAVAIPFNEGLRPYEQVAFQFSHHLVNENGVIVHKGQWLNTEPGLFPNFEFVRALKKELEMDSGSIFRYAAHENSILNAIYRQLKASNENDKELLCDWITTITKSTSDSVDKWQGARNMIDLLELVKKFYYSPSTKGSNSIKEILPAILNSSEYLKEKYSKPIYGTADIQSLNFSSKVWIELDNYGKIINPYKKLDPIFSNIDIDKLDSLLLDGEAELADGGAAMTAYAKMQFTQMRDEEREALQKSLLKYCELDTLAMVMIWEEWNYKINKI